MKKMLSFALLSLMGVMSFTSALAKTEANVGISPSVNNESMSYEVKPGGKVQDVFSIQNLGEKEGTFEVYVVDFDEAKKTEKAFTPVKLQSDPQTGVGLWTALSERYITLDPGEKRAITFFVTVPDNAEKEKNYRGAIVAKLAPLTASKKGKALTANNAGANIAITSSVTTGLSIKVTDNPGATKGSLSELDGVSTNFSADMRNAAMLIIVLLVISIGYLFYRKK